MQVAGVAALRAASRALRAANLSNRCASEVSVSPSPSSSHSRSFRTSFSLQTPTFTGTRYFDGLPCFRASFCSAPDVGSTDSAKGLYDKILESINVKRSAPRNAWLWSLIEKCKSRDDIVLLFDTLQRLRVFRLSNLRIHDNFNVNLCQEVTKACIRAGAVDFGKKVLSKHNVYGLTPTVGSANQLLSYAKMQKDTKLMVDIMSLLKKNDLPLQPATADIIFSICYHSDNWELISKYSKRFLKAGVKLRKTTFDIWMEFASSRGDIESLWNIEKCRSDTYKQHTIKSGISCAKGFLLEGKPDSAATIIQVLNQSFPDSKTQDIIAELQALVSEWPVVVVKHQKQEDQEALVASLKTDIPDMISILSKTGLELSVNLEDLNKAEPMSC